MPYLFPQNFTLQKKGVVRMATEQLFFRINKRFIAQKRSFFCKSKIILFFKFLSKNTQNFFGSFFFEFGTAHYFARTQF